MLAEFGSLNIDGNQAQWLENATSVLQQDFREIDAIVLFYSAFDNNIPANDWYKEQYLNWSIDSLQLIQKVFDKPALANTSSPPRRSGFDRIELNDIRGVRYKKGNEWNDNYYVFNPCSTS